MKKIKTVLALSLSLSFLVGCGGSTTPKLPQTKYEKVQYALNGVENSLKNQKPANRNARLSPTKKRSQKEALDAIYASFSEGTSGQPDFKYDEPPMIQFQYIKKTLEKIGDGFSFGTKYQEKINGSIYYDFSSGDDSQKAESKQDYSLDFSLYISIDESDLITCKTLFDIQYVHGSDTHHQTMYAELFLDYDMQKTDANYTLKLNAVDDCSDYPRDEEKHFSAELDYVDVSEGAIKEWGKLGYSTNKAIVLDDSHPSLANYLTDANLNFKPTIQLYRDGKRYQRNTLSDAQANQVVTIVCDELGVNGRDIRYKEYIGQPSTAQPVLKTCYEDFSKIFGRDLVYNIVYTGAIEEGQGEGGHGEDQGRVDASWPGQDLIDDGYEGVPGFLSKSATFTDNKEYKSESAGYDHYITVSSFEDGDFDRYARTLIENGFVADKIDNLPVFFHRGNGGEYDYGIAFYQTSDANMIIVSKVFQKEETKQAIAIQNGRDYDGEYSSYEETGYRSASEVAAVVERVSAGAIGADVIAPYVISGSSKSYKIHFDLAKYSGDDVKRNFGEYVKLYSDWNVISEGSAFYKTGSAADILILVDKDSSNGIIDIHSFAFQSGSIQQILNGQGGEGGGGGQGGHEDSSSQTPTRVTVNFYEVDSKTGDSKWKNAYEYNEGETINIEALFGPGEYYADSGCVRPLKGEVAVYQGMAIYQKVKSQAPTQGTITIVDANTQQELTVFTDVIGATIKGGAIFNYVLYKDASCGQMLGLDEEITLGEDPIVLYCKDYSEVDYVTLTVNTYINGILSPYQTRDYGVRRGEIMNNIASNSFPVYYSSASYYDSGFTMTFNGNALAPYSSDLIALTENAVLNIYCNNDWCKVYHLTGAGGETFDVLWEGSLSEGDTIFHGSKYYHVAGVKGTTVTVDSTSTAYIYTQYYVYNGKVIITEKTDFPVIDGYGYSFILDPSQDPYFFLDRELTKPLLPKEGENEVVFDHSFTLYARYVRG